MTNKELARTAVAAALETRRKAGASLLDPVNSLDLAGELGVTVRMIDVDMEGMFDGGTPPRIWLSTLRPAARRNFTCAHELGHFIFKHGTSLDQLVDCTDIAERRTEEKLADMFGAYLLMPGPGVIRALNIRGINILNPSPEEVYRISCAFGVGYETLLTHLVVNDHLSKQRAVELARYGPARIRKSLLGFDSGETLTVVDANYEAKTVDVEVGNLVLIANDVEQCGGILRPISSFIEFDLYEAKEPGIGRMRAQGQQWAAFIRVARRGYIGLAAYRHMEECDEP